LVDCTTPIPTVPRLALQGKTIQRAQSMLCDPPLHPPARGKELFHYYFAVINATVVSSMRLEKPHSLSYQLPTLTNVPDTLVSDSS
jgi:hypothetical protein